MEDLDSIQKKLAYTFKNPEWLRQALIHRSYSHENLGLWPKDNERLEFLGDAVLDLVIRHLLLDIFPDHKEGELSKIRSVMVSEATLGEIARGMQLGDYLLLGKGEESTQGRDKDSILADAYEALIAAIYLDGGLESANTIIKRHFALVLEEAAHPDFSKDYKTQLQEYSQDRFKSIPTYRLEKEAGPDHDKTFYIALLINNEIISHGEGRSKKEAEQDAAKKALQLLAAT